MELSAYLTELQKARGLSQSGWAAKSGINRISLWRWQKGETFPREAELSAALVALAATSAEQKRAFHLLAKARDGRGIERIAPLAGIALFRGDLLRALRLRQNLSQKEVAAHCHIRANNLSRWESGDNWPDAATLHRLCFFYGALPAEVVALTTIPDTTEESHDNLLGDKSFNEYVGDFRLLELHYLTELGRFRSSNADVTSREAQLRLDYADYLSFEGRYDDSYRELNKVRASEVWSENYDIVAGYYTTVAGTVRRLGCAVTRKQWLKRTKTMWSEINAVNSRLQLNLRYCAAIFLNDIGDTQMALSLWRVLYDEAQKYEDTDALSGAAALRARLLSTQGDYVAAIEATEKMDKGTPIKDMSKCFVQAEIFTAAHCRQEAIQVYRVAEQCAKDTALKWHEDSILKRIVALENRE